MKIAVFGMGYVGVVSAACLVRDGHMVIGIDPVESKIRDLSQGRSPISEPGVSDLIQTGYNEDRFLAYTKPENGMDVDMMWICVGTPSDSTGEVNLNHVENCIIQIGNVLKNINSRPLIVLRSTVPPGTTRNFVIPLLENTSGLTVGRDIHICFHPEFLREANAIDDFDNPSKIVAGEGVNGGADILFKLYKNYHAPKFRLAYEEAEMAKYCDNIFHAMKITFANEIGLIAKKLKIDARKVAEVYCADTKLNISTKYLKPGSAFGGSCLPKDLRAINRLASRLALEIPMISAIENSNGSQIESLLSRIMELKPKLAGIVGLSFKKDTDDMRESPFVTVAKRLIGEGIKLKIFDPGIMPEKLIGSNKEITIRTLGHLENLLVNNVEDLDNCDCIVINHDIISRGKLQLWLDNSIQIIDLADTGWPDKNHRNYQGIAW